MKGLAISLQAKASEFPCLHFFMKLGWCIYEYDGFAIYPITQEMIETLSNKQMADSRQWPIDDQNKLTLMKPIINEDDLKVGMKVFTKTILDYHWVEATIIQDGNKLKLDTGGNIGLLVFDKDDRHCWICNMMINKNISKLNFDNIHVTEGN